MQTVHLLWFSNSVFYPGCHYSKRPSSASKQTNYKAFPTHEGTQRKQEDKNNQLCLSS
jgi:hypothetical protein